MKKTFCDVCGDEFRPFKTDKENASYQGINSIEIKYSHVDPKIIDICKYCILDEVNKLDDRPIEVKKYGAVGDGIVDDTAAFQAASAAAAIRNAEPKDWQDNCKTELERRQLKGLPVLLKWLDYGLEWDEEPAKEANSEWTKILEGEE